MAAVPATQSGANRRGGLMQNSLLDGMSNLGALRQVGLLIGLAASVAIGVAVVLWSQGGDYRPLYGSLERLDSSAVLDTLDKNKIKYRIDEGTGALMVESNRIHDARLKLAEAGVPGESAVGFELLEKEQPLGTSQFMESARYRRSLEGELARTIASITSVRSARVHLAIPKETVFVRDARPASASVFVELFPGATLAPAQVKSIVNLVAGSIPELKPENVTVVDQKGNLVSQLVLDDPQMVEANKQLEYTHRIEQQLLKRINSILQPIVGEGKFRAEIAANVNFTAVEQADERYNPDLPALRSEQRIEENRAGSEVAGVPGALSNQPPADGQAPEQAGQAAAQGASPQGTGPTAAPAAAGGAKAGPRSREQLVRNYELDRTLSYTKHSVGQLQRVTVAVAVDNKPPKPAADGAALDPAAPPVAWTPEELEQLAILVRNAVGYDAARGDVVNVVNSAFIPVIEEVIEPETVPVWQQPWVRDLAKQAVGVIGVILLVFGVLRPVMKSLSQNAPATSAAMADSPLAAMGPEGAMAMGALGDEQVTLSGGNPNMLLAGPGESYDQQLTAIKGLIAEDPGRVAQVVKKWVAQSE
jgi:flagellar M-ring protein FliF